MSTWKLQGLFDFPGLERAAADRKRVLCAALRQTAADSDMCLLMLMIFEQTCQGMAPDGWEASEELLLGHCVAPRCGRSKLYKLVAAACGCGILLKGRHETGTTYRIGWEAVYALCGRPVPPELVALVDREAQSAVRTVESTTWTPMSTVRTERSARECGGETPRAPPRAPADLTDLTTVDDRVSQFRHSRQELNARLSVEIEQDVMDRTRAEARDLANRASRTIWPNGRNGPLSDRDRLLLLSLALLAVMLFGDEWLLEPCRLAAHPKVKNRLGWVRSVTRNSLWESLAVAASESEAKAMMGHWLVLLHGPAAKILAEGRAVRKAVAETAKER